VQNFRQVQRLLSGWGEGSSSHIHWDGCKEEKDQGRRSAKQNGCNVAAQLF